MQLTGSTSAWLVPITVTQFSTLPDGALFDSLAVDVANFSLTWQDKGSGGKYNGAFYRTKAPDEYHSVGDHGQANYSSATGTIKCYKVKSDVLKSAPYPPLMMPATDFVQIYNDGGSGARMDGSFWWPVVKDASGWIDARYVALGVVSQRGHGKPTDCDAYLVRADVCKAATLSDFVWNDKYTGARMNISAWTVPESNTFWAYGQGFGRVDKPKPFATMFSPFKIDEKRLSP